MTGHETAWTIRANVSMEALVSRHLDAVQEANDAERDARTSGKFKNLCRTAPDATMAASSKAPLRPADRPHAAVDDLAGVSFHFLSPLPGLPTEHLDAPHELSADPGTPRGLFGRSGSKRANRVSDCQNWWPDIASSQQPGA